MCCRTAFGDVGRAFEEADIVVRRRLAVGRHTRRPDGDARPGRGARPCHGPPHHLGCGEGQALQPGRDRGAARSRSGERASRRGRRRRRLRRTGGAVPGGSPRSVSRVDPRSGREVDRGSRRALSSRRTTLENRCTRSPSRRAGTERSWPFEDRAWCDQGAYVRTQGCLPTMLPGAHLPGPYVWQAFSITAHAVLTNRTPVGTYRGPGMTEATFVRERMLDLVAAELGQDPIDLRRRNLVPADRMPFTYDLGPGVPPMVYGSGDYPRFFELLLDAADRDGLRSLRSTSPGKGDRVGIGVAAMVETGGIGPFEEASLEACSDGTVVVRAGVASLGQGIETALGADRSGRARRRHRARRRAITTTPTTSRAASARSRAVAPSWPAMPSRSRLGRSARAPPRRSASRPASFDGEHDSTTLVWLGETRGRFDKEHPSFSFGAALSVVAVNPETGRVTAASACRCPGRWTRGESRDRPRPACRSRCCRGSRERCSRSFPTTRTATRLRFPSPTTRCRHWLSCRRSTPSSIESVVHDNPLGLKGAGEGGVAARPPRWRTQWRTLSGRGERRSTGCPSLRRGFAPCSARK